MIKIVNGTYGQRDGKSIKAVGPGSVIELTPDQEKRLVNLGVAEYVSKKNPTIHVDADGNNNQTELPEYNDSMKFDELKKIAEVYGVDTKGMKSKAEVIEAIEATKSLPGFGGAEDVVD